MGRKTSKTATHNGTQPPTAETAAADVVRPTTAERFGVRALTSPAGAGELLVLPLALIDWNTNTRRTFSEASLAEMAQSITDHGVLQPITVRPHDDDSGPRYEGVLGQRRYRGSTIAGKTTIPAIVRAMSDAEVLMAQTIENLQRENIPPIEESDAMHSLLAMHPEMSILDLGATLGRTPKYVTERLKLRDLIESARAALADGTISLGVALAIAKIGHADQLLAMTFVTQAATEWHAGPMTVKRIESFIGQNLMRQLARVPWKLSDPDLVPTAGSCTACPKRTGNQPLLFGDDATKDDRCTDVACFQGKLATFTQLAVAHEETKAAAIGETIRRVSTGYEKAASNGGLLDKNQWTLVTGKPCALAEYAVVAQVAYLDSTGPKLGTRITICADPKCPEHAGQYGSMMGGNSSTSRGMTPADHKRATDRARAFRYDILMRVLAKAKITKVDALYARTVAVATADRLWHEYLGAIVRRHEWDIEKTGIKERVALEIRKMDSEEAQRFTLECALFGDVWQANSFTTTKGESSMLFLVAKALKIDHNKLHTAAKKEWAAADAERREKKAAAAKRKKEREKKAAKAAKNAPPTPTADVEQPIPVTVEPGAALPAPVLGEARLAAQLERARVANATSGSPLGEGFDESDDYEEYDDTEDEAIAGDEGADVAHDESSEPATAE